MVILNQQTTETLIRETKKGLVFVKKNHRPEYDALGNVIRTRFPHLTSQLSEIYSQLKDYLKNTKDESLVNKEDFIKKNQDDVNRRNLEEKLRLSKERGGQGYWPD